MVSVTSIDCCTCDLVSTTQQEEEFKHGKKRHIINTTKQKTTSNGSDQSEQHISTDNLDTQESKETWGHKTRSHLGDGI